MSKESKKIPIKEKIKNNIRWLTNPKNIAVWGLALVSTIATGFMSYAGAIALGASFPFALTALVLTALVSFQVNIEMIRDAIKQLTHPGKFFNRRHILRNSLFLVMSLLAALSFTATSFFAATALFPFTTAFILTAVSIPAFFLISYNIILDTWKELKTHYRALFSSADTVNGKPKKETKIQKFLQSLKNSHWALRYLTVSLCAAVTAISLYLAVATFPTWWIETKLGLLLMVPISIANIGRILSAPFGAFAHSAFIIKNSIEAILKSSGNINAIFTQESPLIKKIRSTPALLYNLPYLLIVGVAKATSSSLLLAHSLGHALVPGRGDIVVIAGTIADLAADANYTTQSEHNHGNGTEDGHHSHEPFDFMVMVAQVIVTMPLQLVSIPWHFITNIFVNPQTNWKTHLQSSVKDSFFFFGDYIDSKHEHGDDCKHASDTASKTQPALVATGTVAHDTFHNEIIVEQKNKGVSVVSQPLTPRYTGTHPHLSHVIGAQSSCTYTPVTP